MVDHEGVAAPKELRQAHSGWRAVPSHAVEHIVLRDLTSRGQCPELGSDGLHLPAERKLAPEQSVACGAVFSGLVRKSHFANSCRRKLSVLLTSRVSSRVSRGMQMVSPSRTRKPASSDNPASHGAALWQPLRPRLEIIAQVPHDLGGPADIDFAESVSKVAAIAISRAAEQLRAYLIWSPVIGSDRSRTLGCASPTGSRCRKGSTCAGAASPSLFRQTRWRWCTVPPDQALVYSTAKARNVHAVPLHLPHLSGAFSRPTGK